MKKILTSQTNSITGAAVILGIASLTSRIMGIVRDRTFAHFFGAGDTLDAYYAAFRIPDFVYNIVIVGALSATLIPLFTKALAKNKDEAWHVVNTLLATMGLIISLIAVLLALFAPYIVQLLVPGFSHDKQQTVILLTRIMCVSPVILGVSSIVSAVLQSYKNFLIYSLSPIMYNIGIIAGAWLLVPMMGISGLAIGVLLGACLHLAIQLPTLHSHGFRFRPRLDWKHSSVKLMGTMMVPRMLDLAVGDINLMVITAFASTLGSGRITAFQFANNLQTVPIGLIGVSFAVAAFPTLTHVIAEKKIDEFRSSLSATIQQILFFIIPITILFLLLRAQIVRVVLGSGAFDWTATINTANILGFFSLSLFAQSLMPLLVRAFFALEDTWTPFYTSLVSMLVNVIAGFILKNEYGVAGLGMAFSLSLVIECSLLWITLRHKITHLNDFSIVETLLKLSIGALLMAVVVQYLKTPLSHIFNLTTFWGIFAQGAVAGLSGILVYLATTYILRTKPLLDFHASITRRWLKVKPAQSDISSLT